MHFITFIMKPKDVHFPPITLLQKDDQLKSRRGSNIRNLDISETQQITARDSRKSMIIKKLNASQSVERVDYTKVTPMLADLKKAIIKNRDMRLSLIELDLNHYDKDVSKKNYLRSKNDVMNAISKTYDQASEQLTIKILKIVLKAVDVLGMNEVKYKTEMKIISDVIKRAIFMKKDDIPMEISDDLRDDYSNLLNNSDENVPFFHLYSILHKKLCSLKTKYGSLEKNIDMESSKLNKIIEERD